MEAAALGGAVYAAMHFPKNPIVISVIVLFLLYAFFISGNTVVIVRHDSIEFVNSHFWLPFLKRSRKFFYSHISEIDTHFQFEAKHQYMSDVLSSPTFSLAFWNTLTVKLTTGKEKSVITKLYKKDLIKALEHVKALTNNSIPIT